MIARHKEKIIVDCGSDIQCDILDKNSQRKMSNSQEPCDPQMCKSDCGNNFTRRQTFYYVDRSLIKAF